MSKNIRKEFNGYNLSLCETKKISSFFEHDVEKYIDCLIKIEKDVKERRYLKDVELKKKFFIQSDKIIRKGNRLISDLRRNALTIKIKGHFRKMLYPFISKGRIVKRAIDKPRGYPGDYQIIEMFYNNVPVSRGLGFFCDAYILSCDYVKAVRQRKYFMRNILFKYFVENTGKKIKIMNLGSGSCREIRELFVIPYVPKVNAHIILIDQDREALKFSKDELKKVNKKNKYMPRLSFKKKNIIELVREFEEARGIESFDLIYSIGLIDYFPNIILKNLIRYSFGKLKRGGQLILAYKEVQIFTPDVPDWFSDWHFYSRNKNDFVRLIGECLENKGNNFRVAFKNLGNKRITFILIDKI